MISKVKLAATLALIGASTLAHAESPSVEILWRMGARTQSLARWAPDLHTEAAIGTPGAVPLLSLRERDPATGAIAQWKGARLSSLIDSAIATLAPEQKAHIDWIVLHARSGREVLLPRWVATKYPVLLASSRDGKTIAPMSVLPWTSRASLAQEELPLDAFFVSDLTRIELTHAPMRMGSVFLKRRTDPIALRGEKLFTKNCAACHAGTPGPIAPGHPESSAQRTSSGEISRTLSGVVEHSAAAATGAPDLRNYLKRRDFAHGVPRGAPPFADATGRGLARYAQAFASENSGKDPFELLRTAPVEDAPAMDTAPSHHRSEPARRLGLSRQSLQFVR